MVVEAEHLCMSMRGVRKPGSNTVTSAVRGIMRNAATRSEAMSLVLGRRSWAPADGHEISTPGRTGEIVGR